MDIHEACKKLSRSQPSFPRFYGPSAGLSPGVGLFYTGLDFPTYSRKLGEFAVRNGQVYVVSHECDIDQENQRPLNDMAVVCPIIPLETLMARYLNGRTAEQVQAFVDALSKSRVDRAAYIPPIVESLPFGGVLYLNALTHTHASEFQKQSVSLCCAVTAFGLPYLDAALSNAFLKRPKSEPLPLSVDYANRQASKWYRVRTALKELKDALLETLRPKA